MSTEGKKAGEKAEDGKVNLYSKHKDDTKTVNSQAVKPQQATKNDIEVDDKQT
jgi:hypothetical protein